MVRPALGCGQVCMLGPPCCFSSGWAPPCSLPWSLWVQEETWQSRPSFPGVLPRTVVALGVAEGAGRRRYRQRGLSVPMFAASSATGALPPGERGEPQILSPGSTGSLLPTALAPPGPSGGVCQPPFPASSLLWAAAKGPAASPLLFSLPRGWGGRGL